MKTSSLYLPETIAFSHLQGNWTLSWGPHPVPSDMENPSLQDPQDPNVILEVDDKIDAAAKEEGRRSRHVEENVGDDVGNGGYMTCDCG